MLNISSTNIVIFWLEVIPLLDFSQDTKEIDVKVILSIQECAEFGISLTFVHFVVVVLL